VAGGGGTNLILQFWLERRDDRTKCCRKMKCVGVLYIGKIQGG
jgi:hypothetical protein